MNKTNTFLSNEEINNLVILAENGNNQAKDSLFENYVRLAYKIASKANFRNQGLEFEDLTQVALEGLALAVNNVQSEKLTNFYSYAYKCIEDNIKTELCRCNTNVFAYPESQKKSLRKMVAIVSENQKNSDLPLDTLIADAALQTGLDVVDCKQYFSGMKNGQFAELKSNDGSTTSEENIIASRISTEEEATNNYIIDKVIEVLKTLSPLEANFICRAYGINGCLPESGAEIARSYNKTRAWASLVLKRATINFKKAAEEAHLDDFIN